MSHNPPLTDAARWIMEHAQFNGPKYDSDRMLEGRPVDSPDETWSGPQAKVGDVYVNLDVIDQTLRVTLSRDEDMPEAVPLRVEVRDQT